MAIAESTASDYSPFELLAVSSLLPGLSNFVLAFAALLWFLCGMVHWLMGYRNMLLDRASKTSAFGLSEPTITLHP